MPRDRRRGVGRAAWALLTSLAIFGCSPDRSPSVILISVDTLRADHLGIYGYSRPTSPNLDAFARDALVFENAIAHGSETVSTCSSLLTGFLPHETKAIEFHALPLELETLAEMLQQNGYMTVAVVSNYVLRSKQGFSQGFSIYDETMAQREQVRPMPERVAEPTTDRAIELLREHKDDPLFMWIHYQDPHATYAPPERFAELFLDPDREPRLLPVNRLMTGRGRIPRHPGLRQMTDSTFGVLTATRPSLAPAASPPRYVSRRTGRIDLTGTRVEIVRPDGSSLWRRARVAASYCSSNDPRVLVGLGTDPAIVVVRVHWLGGDVEEWRDLEPRRYWTLRRGTSPERTPA